MKTNILTLSVLMLAGLMACSNDKKKDEEKKDTLVSVAPETEPVAETTPEPPMDSAAQMQAWMSYMTPGDMHKMLADMNGEWVEVTTMWMDPAKPPTTSKGTISNRMILGGRYQEGKHKGSFEGMPFEGISTLGYDNATKKFVNTWVDNMGSGIMYTEGTWDEATKTIEMKGKMIDPTTGKDCDIREVIKIIDKDNQVMEMYNTKDGKETKSMESKISRKKT